MKVKTLDNTEYDWVIPEKIAKGNKNSTSSLHKLAKKLLYEKYSNVSIYEEVPIKILDGSRNTLYLDFYLPMFNLAIEVNGQQHYEFSNLFHKNKLHFLTTKSNDTKKAMWCQINNIELVTLKYNDQDNWGDLI